jgi:hypothetical protein
MGVKEYEKAAPGISNIFVIERAAIGGAQLRLVTHVPTGREFYLGHSSTHS